MEQSWDLSRALDALEQSRRETLASYLVFKERGQIPTVQLAELRCSNKHGCLLLHIFQLPRGRAYYLPPYRLAPRTNLEKSTASGRAKNTRDGNRKWVEQAGLLGDTATFMLNCDHVYQHIISIDEIKIAERPGETRRRGERLNHFHGRKREQQAYLAFAMGDTAEKTDIAARSYLEAADQATAMRDALLNLINTVNDSNDVGQDAVSKNAAYQESLAKVDEYIKNLSEGVEGYSAGIDENTAAGSANAAMLENLASQSQANALAQFTLNGNTDQYRATLEAGRQAVIDRAIQLGATADQAVALADKIYAIPSEKQFTMIAETAAANAEIQRIKDLIDSVPASRRTTIGVTVESPFSADPTKRANGGAIYGPGGPRDDRIPSMLSNGEHVLTASDVAAMGGQAAVYAFRSGLHKYAYGGAVQPSYGGGFRSSTARVSVSPSLSMKGARVVIDLGGQQLEGIIQEQILAADARAESTIDAGWRLDK